jgi:UDP-N-acetylglucosamine 2-epimerase (non-hydrolysing)
METARKKIVNVVGARPNLVKIAPLVTEMDKHPGIDHLLLHTGQHYDYEMSQVFFEELALQKPDVYLGVGSASHAVQTAKIMVDFEKFCLDWCPDLVLVVGDVNSTLACTLTAAKLHIPVAHVEAGLRSFDRRMPEEINRIVTDALSTYLFTPSRDGDENLRNEGIPDDRIFFVGNVMIDTLLTYLDQISHTSPLSQFNLSPKNYLLLTLHRPSSVDNHDVLLGILEALELIQREIPILFPIHPRTARQIKEHGLAGFVDSLPNLKIIKPVGYLTILSLMSNATAVLTDSGGMQEETTILGVPCLTLRENTERPVTVTEGTNKIIGTSPEAIVTEARRILAGTSDDEVRRVPELWDGRTSERIVEILWRELQVR